MNNFIPQPWSTMSEIQFIGFSENSGSTITVPQHQKGDLIIICARASGTGGAPIPGAPAGWSVFCSSRPPPSSFAVSTTLTAGFIIAQSASEVSGTWSDAGRITCAVYRNALGVGQANVFTTSSGNIDPTAINIARGGYVGVATSSTVSSISGLTMRSSETLSFFDSAARAASVVNLPNVVLSADRSVLVNFEILHKG